VRTFPSNDQQVGVVLPTNSLQRLETEAHEAVPMGDDEPLPLAWLNRLHEMADLPQRSSGTAARQYPLV